MPSTTTPSVIAAVSLGAIVDVKDKNSLYATWLLAHCPISINIWTHHDHKNQPLDKNNQKKMIYGPIMTIKINHWIKTTIIYGYIWTHHEYIMNISWTFINHLEPTWFGPRPGGQQPQRQRTSENIPQFVYAFYTTRTKPWFSIWSIFSLFFQNGWSLNLFNRIRGRDDSDDWGLNINKNGGG